MKPSFAETPTGNRRKFLKQLSAGSLAALAYPALAGAGPLPAFTHSLDEAYWEVVKKQFTVPGNLIMLNAANLCPSPQFISERVISFTKDLNKDVSFQYRSVFSERRAKAIAMLAPFIGVEREELGITRNTSESNGIVVNGLDFKAGDEIITWEQNHPSNGIAWEKLAKRYGLIVKKILLPSSPVNIEELVTPFSRAITSKTRLIAFSHISNLSGMALPAKEICSLAKAKGILTLVDGAQSLGMMELNLKSMGCDFYTASTHKWLMGPMENGILYVRKELLELLWPNIIGGGWKEEGRTVDEKICVLGQRNDPTTAALPDIIEFHLTIGKKNIEDRAMKLIAYLKEQIRIKIPQATFLTPLSAGMSGAIVVFNLPGKDPKEIHQKLYEVYGIATAATGGVRLSPHIYNTIDDLNKVVEALTRLVG